MLVRRPGFWCLVAPVPDERTPDVGEEDAIISRRLVTITQTFYRDYRGSLRHHSDALVEDCC